ncbi:hypothetical protein Aduo_015231 [Ancylostoma duodenale]
MNFITNTDVNENEENKKPKTVETLIKDLYATIRENLLDRFENSEARTEVHRNAFYSINRGYPAYIHESDGAINPEMRQKLIEQSIDLLSKYCNVPNPYNDFVASYNALNGSVSNFDNWPTDIEDDYSSLRLYSILLNNADRLRIPSKVVQVSEVPLVISASRETPREVFLRLTDFRQQKGPTSKQRL